ncbi:hypothetical protein RYX36_020981 [Vicia faba]
MQLFDKKDHGHINIGPYKKVQQSIESTKNAMKPHFEVHNVLYKLKMRLSVQQSSKKDGQIKSGIKAPIISKIHSNESVRYEK